MAPRAAGGGRREVRRAAAARPAAHTRPGTPPRAALPPGRAGAVVRVGFRLRSGEVAEVGLPHGPARALNAERLCGGRQCQQQRQEQPQRRRVVVRSVEWRWPHLHLQAPWVRVVSRDA